MTGERGERGSLALAPESPVALASHCAQTELQGFCEAHTGSLCPISAPRTVWGGHGAGTRSSRQRKPGGMGGCPHREECAWGGPPSTSQKGCGGAGGRGCRLTQRLPLGVGSGHAPVARAAWQGGPTLPRTPYGPCRRSGCTAAAGPPDCSPSYRAPGRQEKVFGAGLPLAKVPAALTGAQWPTQRAGGQSGYVGGGTRTLSGPHNLACRMGASALTRSCWGMKGALPGSPAAAPDGTLPQGGGRGRKTQWFLNSRRPQAW